MKPYIIYSLARCGSTTLARILNLCAPNDCVIEPFDADFERGFFLKLAVDQGLSEALSAIWRSHRGIKHVWHPLGWPFPHGSLLNTKLLLTPGCKIIILHRKNVLKRVVSHEIARQSRIWHADTTDNIIKRSAHCYAALDLRIIASYIKNELDLIEAKRTLLRQSSGVWFDLSFESLFTISPLNSKISTLSQIAAFTEIDLDLNNLTVYAQIRKYLSSDTEQSSEVIYRQIPNIADVERIFGSSETGHLFK